MSDKKEKPGKQWRGQQFVTDVTPEDVAEKRAVDAMYGADENAVPIEVWFMKRGHRDPVMQAGMLAYTKVRKATIAVFDDIFSSF